MDNATCSQCGSTPCLCDTIGIDKDYELTLKIKMRAPTMIKAVNVLHSVLDGYVSAGYIQSHSVEEGKELNRPKEINNELS